MSRLLSETIRKQVLDLFQQGWSSWAIAKKLGIGATTVSNWHHAFLRQDLRWTSCVIRKNTEATAYRAVELYSELGSYSAVAHELGSITAGTVKRYVSNIKKYGRPFAPKDTNQHPQPELQALLQRLKSLEQGDTCMATNISKTTESIVNNEEFLSSIEDKTGQRLFILMKNMIKAVDEVLSDVIDDKKKVKCLVQYFTTQLSHQKQKEYPPTSSVKPLTCLEVPSTIK